MTASRDLDWLLGPTELARWEREQPRGSRSCFVACPVHGGSDSLHLTEKDGTVLAHCFADDCGYASVVAALRRCGWSGGHRQRDRTDGSKDFRWSWPGGKRPLDQVTLYGNEDPAGYDRAKPVIVTEGERKRDRLVAVGYQAVALIGSKPTPSADVLAVLQGWDVLLWPDNDAPGRTAMDNVPRVIAGKARRVAIVGWAGAPPKGDAADFLDGHTVEDCDDLLNAAEPFQGDPPGWGGGSVDVLDLLESDYPELAYVVDGILPEGTAILASNPKIGKSAMIYQLSAGLALGGSFLGRRLTPRPVHYFPLKDGERRSQKRAADALRGRRPRRGMLGFRWAAPKLGEGLEDEIEAWLDAHARGVLRDFRGRGLRGRGGIGLRGLRLGVDHRGDGDIGQDGIGRRGAREDVGDALRDGGLGRSGQVGGDVLRGHRGSLLGGSVPNDRSVSLPTLTRSRGTVHT